MHQLSAKRRAALDAVDHLPPELRALVHDFGWPLVQTFLACGVTKPGAIRHLITMCWQNAQGAGTERRRGMEAGIDAMLLREGGAPSAAVLAALLKGMGTAILPVNASDAMVRASIAETERHGLMSKEKKHRVRLLAAMRVSAAEHWPGLWGGDA